MADTRVIVEIKNLNKSYRRGGQILPVLENISLDIAQGEFLALMGPSGSGKSTLLNLIAGLDHADSGIVAVDGVDITSLSETELAGWRAGHVGFIFQFYHLIPVLTAFENVELPLTLTNLSKKDRREHVATALQLVKLSDRMDHYPRQLSGGQQQRVAIARAVVTDPTILVADEPTGDLDRSSAAEVLQFMERLSEDLGKTIIMVTHDLRAARKARVLRHLDKGVLTNAPETVDRPDHSGSGRTDWRPGPELGRRSAAVYGKAERGFRQNYHQRHARSKGRPQSAGAGTSGQGRLH